MTVSTAMRVVCLAVVLIFTSCRCSQSEPERPLVTCVEGVDPMVTTDELDGGTTAIHWFG